MAARWFLLLALFALSKAGTQKTTRTRQVRVGDTVKLKCQAELLDGFQGLLWEEPESDASKVRSVISSTSVKHHKCVLKIFQAVAEDTGYYTCKYRAGDNATAVSRRVVKRVYLYVFDNHQLILAPPSITASPDRSLVIPCKPTHQKMNVTISKIISNVRSLPITFDSTKGFTINNVTEHDEGFWNCSARIGHLTKSKHIFVNVLNAPAKNLRALGRVDIEPLQQRLVKGDSISLRCLAQVRTELRASIDWQAPKDETFQVTFGQVPEKDLPEEISKYYRVWWSQLTISNATVNDSGRYWCVVGHQEEQLTVSSDVVVYESPFIRIEHRPAEIVRALTGSTVVLNFTIDSVPAASWRWYNGTSKLYDDVVQGGRYRLSPKINISDYRLSLSDLGHQDTGIYTLVITNGILGVNESVRISVIDPAPPKLIAPFPSEVSLIVGDDHDVACNVSGAPEPEVTWFHDGVRTQATGKVLRFVRITVEEAGNYSCVANNPSGTIVSSQSIQVADPRVLHMALFSTISVALLVTAVCAVVLLVSRTKRHKKLQRQMQIQQKYLVPVIDTKQMPIEEQAEILAYDPKKWEFPRDRLKFGKTLGRGAFGKVVQATAFDMERTSSCKTVAVKMLKVGSRASEYQALMSELKILIHLGPHLNIVNLLGACTTKDGPLMIIVEYCRNGNLSSYLRSMRDCYVGGRTGTLEKKDSYCKKDRLLSDDSVDDGAFSSLENDRSSWLTDKRVSRASCTSTADTLASHECSEMTGNTHLTSGCEDSRMSLRKSSETNDDETKEKKQAEKATLNLTDLLSYSLQVARGMEFLASKKCIHRDLAARNVLLSDYQVVKICDFGLARDVYKDPDYVQNGDARLPIKWMAPESIFDKVYSSKSDVWSFGVLLWEIFSLGGSPYPGIQMDGDFCEKLRRGVRMSKPQYSSDAAYSNMLACWSSSPEERPTFTKLCEELSDVLQEEAGHEYLDILKIFEGNAEGKVPLRGVTPPKSPEEVFEVKAGGRNCDPCTSYDSVNYTDIQFEIPGHGSTRKAKKREGNTHRVEITHESVSGNENSVSDFLAEEGDLCRDKNLLYVDTSSFRSLDTCSAASSCDAPPLYDDVIASWNHT